MSDPRPIVSFGADWSATFRRGDAAELHRWLQFALDCANGADELALGYFRADLDIERKADGSLVTQADKAIETFVRDRIASAFPTHGVTGEEFGRQEGSVDFRWYLDPIDGTHNFLRGIPLFGFLLALERDGELQVGVMSAPALHQRWYAARGQGAWAIETWGQAPPRRLHVSAIDTLGESQIVFRSIGDMRASRVARGFDRLLSETWRERGFGDYWGYALVADASAEAMMEQDLGPWDLAAPLVVVEEAGGAVTDFDGRRSLERGEALASNGVLHADLLDRLRRGITRRP
jgi:histidinol-phosphatase